MAACLGVREPNRAARTDSLHRQSGARPIGQGQCWSSDTASRTASSAQSPSEYNVFGHQLSAVELHSSAGPLRMAPPPEWTNTCQCMCRCYASDNTKLSHPDRLLSPLPPCKPDRPRPLPSLWQNLVPRQPQTANAEPGGQTRECLVDPPGGLTTRSRLRHAAGRTQSKRRGHATPGRNGNGVGVITAPALESLRPR